MLSFQKDPPSSLNRESFVARYGGVYDGGAWVAQEVWDAGSASDMFDAMAAAMREVVEASAYEKQLALLREYPDFIDRLAVVDGPPPADGRDQFGSGLDQCSQSEFAQFVDLNARYAQKVEFPFILSAKGYLRRDILEIFRCRVNEDPADEFRNALEQTHRIAGLRLEALADER